MSGNFRVLNFCVFYFHPLAMWQKLFKVYNLNLELTHVKFQDKSSEALKVTASFTLSFT